MKIDLSRLGVSSRRVALAKKYFDLHWYLTKNPDIQDLSERGDIDGRWAFKHYVDHGIREGRSPSPLVDPLWYAEQHVGADAERLALEDVLAHFEDVGKKNGYSLHPLVDTDWYLSSNQDVERLFKQQRTDPYTHYVGVGAREKRSPHPLFDAKWYWRQREESRHADSPTGYDAVSDYLLVGVRLGISPHVLFDREYYLSRNPDVSSAFKQGGEEPLTHYVKYGAIEGRQAHPLFDDRWYAIYGGAKGTSIKQALSGGLVHYLRLGRHLGLSPHPLFDAEWYLKVYPKSLSEMVEFGDDALANYVKHANQRLPHPLLQSKQAASVSSAGVLDVFAGRAKWGDVISVRRDAACAVQKYKFARAYLENSALELYGRFSRELKEIVDTPVVLGLRPIMDCEISPSNEKLVANGGDPQLEVLFESSGHGVSLVGGVYKFVFNARVLDGVLSRPALYIDFGAGFVEAVGSKVHFVEVGDGRWEADLDLAFDCLRLRFDPSEQAFEAEGVSLQMCGLADQASGGRYVSMPGGSNLSLFSEYQERLSVAKGGRSPSYAPRRQQRVDVAPGQTKIIAFYLPQFHPFHENDGWWGKGFTEWTNVSKAVPQFRGHYLPRLPGELGFYDLRSPGVIAEQIDLAKTYGVSAFCFHYYWFDGHRLMEKPLDAFLADKTAAADFPFCICWANENWTRRWDGDENEVLIAQNHSPRDNEDIFHDLSRYMKDERYVKVDNKPLIVVYRLAIVPNADKMIATWNELARAEGWDGIYVVATNSFGFQRQPSDATDAICEFPPHGVVCRDRKRDVTLLNEEFAGAIYEYDDVVEYSIERLEDAADIKGDYFPGVMGAWDNEARRPGRGNVFKNATPGHFYRWLNAACRWSDQHNAPGRNFVFINAWNEWGEGTYLEPDRMFGYALLSAVAAVRDARRVMDPRLDEIRLQRVRRARSALTAVCIHLFYFDLLPECVAAVQQIRSKMAVDIILTIPKTWTYADAKAAADALDPVRFLTVENCGRDVLPFIDTLGIMSELGYEFGCKLHSKKSLHVTGGDAWRKALFSSLVDAAAMRAVESSLIGTESSGILAPSSSMCSVSNASTMRDNLDNIKLLKQTLDLEKADVVDFVAGSMFWFRRCALDRLLVLVGAHDAFGPELGAIDGTTAHAIERLFPTIALAAGFETVTYGELKQVSPY